MSSTFLVPRKLRAFMGRHNKLFWKSTYRYSIHDTASIMKGFVDTDKTVESIDPTFLSGKIFVIVVHNLILWKFFSLKLSIYNIRIFSGYVKHNRALFYDFMPFLCKLLILLSLWTHLFFLILPNRLSQGQPMRCQMTKKPIIML